jgi:hypothetical protein
MFIARQSNFLGKLLKFSQQAANDSLDIVPVLVLAIEQEGKHLREARFGPTP